jgi:hypothetical protein
MLGTLYVKAEHMPHNNERCSVKISITVELSQLNLIEHLGQSPIEGSI